MFVLLLFLLLLLFDCGICITAKLVSQNVQYVGGAEVVDDDDDDAEELISNIIEIGQISFLLL